MHERRWSCCAFFLLLLLLSCGAPVSMKPIRRSHRRLKRPRPMRGDKVTAEEASGDAGDAVDVTPAGTGQET